MSTEEAISAAPIAIFDLDGCLSDDRARRKFLPGAGVIEPNYDLYHSTLSEDEAMNEEFVLAHFNAKDFILFITARPNSVREATHEWLARKFPTMQNGKDYVVLMRGSGDLRSAPELKIALFDRWASEQPDIYPTPEVAWFSVAAAYDDRHDVLEAYAARGIGRRGYRLTFPEPVADLVEGYKVGERHPIGNVMAGKSNSFFHANWPEGAIAVPIEPDVNLDEAVQAVPAPPLGVVPVGVWASKRVEDLVAAIGRQLESERETDWGVVRLWGEEIGFLSGLFINGLPEN